MLQRTSAASRIADASQPAISAGSHTSWGLSLKKPVSQGGILTGIQPLFATRNSQAITRSSYTAARCREVDRVADRRADEARALDLAIRDADQVAVARRKSER